MSDKIVAITGTTSGTGYVAALELAKRGAKVILLNRASGRFDLCVKNLRLAESREGAFDPIECNLQSFDSVRKAAATIKSRYKTLDVLINNAGIMAVPVRATADGYGVQMETNVISHFLLTKELFPLLQAAKQGRVINHTSEARNVGPDLEPKYFEKMGDDDLGDDGTTEQAMKFEGPRWVRYHMSKLANAAFTYALKDHVSKSKSDTSVLSLLAHPGLADTALTDKPSSSGGMFSGDTLKSFVSTGQTAEDGACGILRAAMDPNAQSGDFFGPVGEGEDGWKKGFPERLVPEPSLYSETNMNVMWKGCEGAVGTFEV